MQLATTHPDPSACQCQHVQAYLKREQEGGGIVAIERIAGDVLKPRAAKEESEDDSASARGDSKYGKESIVPIPLKRSRA